jgi:hypothetical protein
MLPEQPIKLGPSPKVPGYTVWALPSGREWKFELRNSNDRVLYSALTDPEQVWKFWGVKPPYKNNVAVRQDREPRAPQNPTTTFKLGEAPKKPGCVVHAAKDGEGFRFELRDVNTGTLRSKTTSAESVYSKWGVDPPRWMCRTKKGQRWAKRPAEAEKERTTRRVTSQSDYQVGRTVISRHNVARRAKIVEVRVVDGLLGSKLLELYAHEIRTDGTRIKREPIKVTPAHWKLTP